MAQNFYDILGVHRDASVDEIKKAFKRAALTHHPDKGGDPEKFKEIGSAQETLTDQHKRAAYDSSLLRARSRDGLGARYTDRSGSHDRTAATSAPRPAPAERQQTSRPPPPRPPRPPGGAVEIPADPSSLSVKELKELLTALGIDHDGCLEKADLLAALQKRKERRSADGGSRENTPRASTGSAAGAGKPASTTRSSSKDGSAKTSGAPPASSVPERPSEMKEPRALRVKVMSLGSAAVGKSTLIKRYCEGRFVQKYICTIGIDYGVKPVHILGRDVKVNFFDTSGGNEFKDIRVEFYEQGETRGFVLVYDVTNKKTFVELDDWLDEARRHKCPLSKTHRSGDLPFVVLCANKVDLPKRMVTAAEGQAYAARHGMYYYETSAATGESVADAMNFLFEQIVQRHSQDRKRLGAG